MAGVEVLHEKRYLQLLEHLKNDATFKGERSSAECRNCGIYPVRAEALQHVHIHVVLIHRHI